MSTRFVTPGFLKDVVGRHDNSEVRNLAKYYLKYWG